MFASIVEAVASHSAEYPQKLCLVDKATELTYRETWNLVASAASMLKELGSAGKYIAIECNQGVGFAIAMLATQLAGATAVPLERNIAAPRRADIASKIPVHVFIGQKNHPEFESATFVEYDMLCKPTDQPHEWLGGFPSAGSDSEVMFSTGTTGIPKGVVLTHRNETAMSENIIAGLKMQPDTVELILVPLNHAFGLRRMNANLMNGSTVLVAEGALALKGAFNLMDKYGANALALSANTLSVVFKLSGDQLGQYAEDLAYVQLSSAMLPDQDKEKLKTLLPNTRLYNFYGSTESGATCLFDFNTMDDKPYCIGLPIGDARFIVVDDSRNPIESSPDNMGILASACSTNMRCYLNDPELTAETLQGGFVYTKDLGYIDENGFVYVIGRADDVINVGGVKIAPEEIEQIVNGSPIVSECACVPVADALTGQAAVLCIVLEKDAIYNEKEFRTFLASSLGINERPKRTVVLEGIPRTYNGKIKRRELVKKLEERTV